SADWARPNERFGRCWRVSSSPSFDGRLPAEASAVPADCFLSSAANMAAISRFLGEAKGFVVTTSEIWSRGADKLWVGVVSAGVRVLVFSDADTGAGREDARRTGGGLVAILGRTVRTPRSSGSSLRPPGICGTTILSDISARIPP